MSLHLIMALELILFLIFKMRLLQLKKVKQFNTVVIINTCGEIEV